MTLKEREDHFIEMYKKEFGNLTFECEHLLRYGYSRAAEELSRVAFTQGVRAQQDNVLEALGAVSHKLS